MTMCPSEICYLWIGTRRWSEWDIGYSFCHIFSRFRPNGHLDSEFVFFSSLIAWLKCDNTPPTLGRAIIIKPLNLSTHENHHYVAEREIFPAISRLSFTTNLSLLKSRLQRNTPNLASRLEAETGISPALEGNDNFYISPSYLGC